MPSFRHHELGDLYVRINVKFPESIDPAVIPALEQALPARKSIGKLGKNVHMDEVTLEEPNDRQKRSAASNGDEMDEDEEDGRPGVQCAHRKSIAVVDKERALTYRISALFAGILVYSRSAQFFPRLSVIYSRYTPSHQRGFTLCMLRPHHRGMRHESLYGPRGLIMRTLLGQSQSAV